MNRRWFWCGDSSKDFELEHFLHCNGEVTRVSRFLAAPRNDGISKGGQEGSMDDEEKQDRAFGHHESLLIRSTPVSTTCINGYRGT